VAAGQTRSPNELIRLLEDSGGRGIADQELLILLLSRVVEANRVEPVARELIDYFGSLDNVMAASVRELQGLETVPKAATMLLTVVGEIVARCRHAREGLPEVLREPAELKRYLLAAFRDLSDERLLIVFLDHMGVVLGQEFLGTGTIDQVVAFPRKVMESALRHNASRLLMVHNHLHGPPIPTLRDREEAERLRAILRPFDITVQDSIVVGGNRCFSVFTNTPL
jgi:DNA repair protein RadC